MERLRPKIKLKGAAKNKEVESVQSERTQESFAGDPASNAPGEPVSNVGHGEGFFPVITGGIKRKRAPRAGERRMKAVPSVHAEEEEFSGQDDNEGKEDVEEDVSMTDGRQVMMGNKSVNIESVEVKATQPIQRRQGHFKVKVKSSKLQEGSPVHPEKQKGSDDDNSYLVSVALASQNQDTAAGALRECQRPASSEPDKSDTLIEKPSGKMLKSARSLDRVNTTRQIRSNRSNEMANSPHQSEVEKSHWNSENLETKVLGTSEETLQKHTTESHAVEKGQSDHSEYNEKELKDALMVVKKIMKMEAAEPFNTPVNPVALGIPDYFDVIDTPMDLGTICSTLERGEKYMNSRDVFKDVQFIWENCYKYNSKGDPILDLMKRVKKNFVKYWTAADLYYEQPKRISAVQLSGQGDAASNRESGRLEESEMEHEGDDTTDGNREDSETGKMKVSTIAQPYVRSPKVKDKHAEQVIAEDKASEEKLHQEKVKASYVQSCSKEPEVEVDIVQSCQADAMAENKGVKLKIKKSKYKHELQDKTVLIEKKPDCISTGADEESGLKAGDSDRFFMEETQQKDLHSKSKTRRRHGKYHHKDGCLCAVCIARRRRRAREENAQLAKKQSTMAGVDQPGKIKEEVSEFLEKPSNDEGGTKLDNMLEADLVAQQDEQGDECKVETQEEEGETQEQEEEEAHKHEGRWTDGRVGGTAQRKEQKELQMQLEEEAQQQEKKESHMRQEEEMQLQEEKESLMQWEDDEQQQEVKETQMQQEEELQQLEIREGQRQEEEETQLQEEGDMQQEEGESGRYYTADYEIPLQYASPSIMQMCEALFTSNPYSVWNRAHSLSNEPSISFSDNQMVAAVSTFME